MSTELTEDFSIDYLAEQKRIIEEREQIEKLKSDFEEEEKKSKERKRIEEIVENAIKNNRNRTVIYSKNSSMRYDTAYWITLAVAVLSEIIRRQNPNTSKESSDEFYEKHPDAPEMIRTLLCDHFIRKVETISPKEFPYKIKIKGLALYSILFDIAVMTDVISTPGIGTCKDLIETREESYYKLLAALTGLSGGSYIANQLSGLSQ